MMLGSWLYLFIFPGYPQAATVPLETAYLLTAEFLTSAALIVSGFGMLTHRWWGLPILAIVLFACYEFVGVLGAGTAVNFLEKTVFAEWVVPALTRAVRFVVPAGAVQTFLVGPPGVDPLEHAGFLVGKYGVVSMGLSYGLAIVLPIVLTFFTAFALLEDSGYLPRLAVMSDRVFRLMGLNGKAVLPMVLGLGCDTMATLTTRILPTRKERLILTLLLAGVPCAPLLVVMIVILRSLPASATLFFAGFLLASNIFYQCRTENSVVFYLHAL